MKSSNCSSTIHNPALCWQMLQYLFIVVTLALTLIVMKFLIWRKNFCKLMPGREPRFLDPLGNLSEMSFSENSRNGHSLNVLLLQFLGGYAKLFEKQVLHCVWFFFEPIVILTKAEAISAALNGTKMNEKSWFYRWIQPALGFGLVTSGGKRWKSRRKLLNPCFHNDILKNYVPAMNRQSFILVKLLQKEMTKDFTDVVLPISLCALDIICETMLGIRSEAQGGEINEYSEFVEALSRAMDLIVERTGNCLLWSDFIYKFSRSGREMKKYLQIGENFTRRVIREKKEQYLKGELKIAKSKRNSLMDVLLEHHLQTNDFSEEDIREELITFTIAGHDTSATSVTWCLYLIGLHANVQLKIHEELDRTFGNDTERPATLEDIANLKYLECVFKESNRLYPPAPFFARDATEDTIICGYSIPKGSTCVAMAYYLHRDEEVFPNAEKFDPDRFLPENSINRHSCAYIPFSVGPRNCIGQRFALIEAKVILSTILRNYTIESLDSRDVILASLKIHLQPSMPIRIRIRQR